MASAGKMVVALVAIDIIFLILNVNTGNGLIQTNGLININMTRSGNITTGTINTTGNYTQSLVPNNGGIVSLISQAFVLPIFLILTLLNIIVSLFFAPVAFLQLTGAPFEIVAIVGGIMMVMYVIAITGVVRGGDL